MGARLVGPPIGDTGSNPIIIGGICPQGYYKDANGNCVPGDITGPWNPPVPQPSPTPDPHSCASGYVWDPYSNQCVSEWGQPSPIPAPNTDQNPPLSGIKSIVDEVGAFLTMNPWMLPATIVGVVWVKSGGNLRRLFGR